MWPSRIQDARGFNNSSLKFFKKEKEKGRKVQKHQEQVLPPRVQLRNLAYQSFRALASLYKFHLEIITKATRKRMVLLNICLFSLWEVSSLLFPSFFCYTLYLDSEKIRRLGFLTIPLLHNHSKDSSLANGIVGFHF